MSDTAPQWDVSEMKSAYCSLAKATATKDAVVLNLGVAGGGAGDELKPQLLHRVHLAPAAAQRLHEVLGRLLAEYAAGR